MLTFISLLLHSHAYEARQKSAICYLLVIYCLSDPEFQPRLVGAVWDTFSLGKGASSNWHLFSNISFVVFDL